MPVLAAAWVQLRAHLEVIVQTQDLLVGNNGPDPGSDGNAARASTKRHAAALAPLVAPPCSLRRWLHATGFGMR